MAAIEVPTRIVPVTRMEERFMANPQYAGRKYHGHVLYWSCTHYDGIDPKTGKPRYTPHPSAFLYYIERQPA